MINMKFVRLVLFFGVLAVGMLAGFSIGYDHGTMEAKGRARTAALRFYNEFKANTQRGHIFSLWDFKVMPLGDKRVRVCGNEGYMDQAGGQGRPQPVGRDSASYMPESKQLTSRAASD